MKNIILLVFITIFISPAFSQKYGEAGLFVGGAYYFGDVHSDLTENTHFSTGINFRQNLNSRWAWNTFFKYASISGDDANADSFFEKQRNLSFQSNIFEVGSVVEFNFLDFKPYKPQSFFQLADVFTPYVVVGISLFYHNPKAYLAGNLYVLRPLQTEGESYTKVSVALPFGFGFKVRVTDRVLMGASIEFRPTFTDYLDDVHYRYPSDPSSLTKTGRDLSNRTIESQAPGGTSWGAQRGNEYNNDWFSYVGISVSYNLKKNPGTCHFNPSK